MIDAKRQLRQKIIDGTYYAVTARADEIKKLLSTRVQSTSALSLAGASLEWILIL